MPEVKTVQGCCPLDCQDTCAWIATVEEGRVTKVAGDPNHPITRGVLCAKVNDYQERTYSPDRILLPLKRIGPKGEGHFEATSWDEALDLIAGNFREIIRMHGGEALLPLNYLGSMGVLQRKSLMRVFHALGASRFHGSICGASGNQIEAEGHPRGLDPEDLMQSELIILWGANILTTSHHHFHFIREAQKQRGAKLICIDPRRTMTAKACDMHISIKPGTDMILAAGLAHVILQEGLADLDFARQVATDLDAFVLEVANWTPARVSEVCGIEADVITQLARDFAHARPATIRSGVAPQQTRNGEAFVRSLSALAIICGHWKLKGGGLMIESVPVFHERAASRPDLMPHETRSLDLARIGDHLLNPHLEPPIKGLMVWNMNPAVDQPDVARVRKGLAREDLFTVVLEHFMTDTARYADVILPSTTQLEHLDAQGAWGHYFISLNYAAIPPLGESKPHSEVMRLLAKRLGLNDAAFLQSDEEMIAACMPDGLTMEELKLKGWVKSPPPPLSWHDRRLRIASRIEAPESPDNGYLQMLTPKTHYFMNSSFANMPRQRRAMKGPTLEMHEDDAQSRNLVDGQEVTVRNAQGVLRARLHISTDIHRGVVSLPGKWWSTPQETNAVGNLLTPSAWSSGGQPAYNETWVEVHA